MLLTNIQNSEISQQINLTNVPAAQYHQILFTAKIVKRVNLNMQPNYT